MIDVAQSSGVLPQAVAGKLRGLRGSVRRWLLVDGLTRLLWCLLALAAADLAIDWYFRMDFAQRAMSLGLCLLLLAVLAYRRLLRPLARPLEDDALVLRVEDRNRELGQSLISAVQFSRGIDAEALGVSPAMVRATIDQGTAAATTVDFTSVLDSPRFRRNLLLVLAALAALLGLGVAVTTTGPMWIWFDRNVLLGELEWPQDTYLSLKGVEDNRLLLPRGDDWEQVVEVQGVVPSLVHLDYKPKGWSSRVTEQMGQVGDRNFHTLFKNVLDTFEFRVRGGDAQTRWINVELIERPTVENLELKLTPPAYAGIKPEVLPPGKGPYYALKGSRLEISGTASKDLSAARLLIGEQPHGEVQITAGRQFSTVIEPGALSAQTYSIELTDADRWQSKRPARFAMKIRPDRDPTVKAKLDGISGLIVPGARVPLACTLADDFAVTRAVLVYRWRSDTSDQTGSSGELELDELKSQYGKAKIVHRYPFETGPLGLQVGSTLSFHVEAVDNDTVSGPKSGKSDEFAVKVVTEEELRGDLLRREKEQRLEVERLLKDQEDLLTDCRAILATVQNKKDMPDDMRQLLVKVQKRQNLASDRAAAVAGQLSQIIVEVQNNRLEEAGGPIERRLVGHIIEPLRSLASQNVPKAAAQLDAARRAPEASRRDAELANAAAEQQVIALALRDVLKYMAKSEGYQEAVNLLYAILKSQSDLNEGTSKEAQRRIRELFGPEKDPKQGPKNKE